MFGPNSEMAGNSAQNAGWKGIDSKSVRLSFLGGDQGRSIAHPLSMLAPGPGVRTPRRRAKSRTRYPVDDGLVVLKHRSSALRSKLPQEEVDGLGVSSVGIVP